MALRNIVIQGEPCLQKVCRPVTEFNHRLHVLLDDMTDTLAEANGAGLAAPQVGVLRRVCIVMDEGSGEYLELVNPEIIAQSGANSLGYAWVVHLKVYFHTKLNHGLVSATLAMF